MDSARGQIEDGAQAPDGNSADMLSPEAQLEAEIAFVRHEIGRLKKRLKSRFDEPGSFTAAGDELRQATERLKEIEADLKTMKLEAREEVWWSSSRRGLGGAAKLTRSLRYSDRRAGR